jgi:hypothetical protein
MNGDLRETELNNEDGQGMTKRVWLNPDNQSCFNSGWFTYQDFYDWTMGKGRIVKGKTDEEKKKFWDVAVFMHENDYAWAFMYHMKDFHYIDETYRPESKKTWGLERYIKTPLKITKTNHIDIISKAFGYTCAYYGDTIVKPTHGSHFLAKMREELDGVKQTLYLLGVGYFGACNTPEEPENLSWIADICLYKAAYLYYVKNEIPLPDFEFVYNNRYKLWQISTELNRFTISLIVIDHRSGIKSRSVSWVSGLIWKTVTKPQTKNLCIECVRN